MTIRPMALAISCAVLAAALGGCGGGGGGGGANNNAGNTASFTIGGTVAGLLKGEQLTLANSNGDALDVTGNGTFTFPTALAANAAYAVTIKTPPAGASCTISNASGSATAAVSNVTVSCSPVAVKNLALFLDSVHGTLINFTYDPSSGTLVPLAAPSAAAGAGANAIALNASATGAYVLVPAETGPYPRAALLSAFTVDPGGLVSINGAPLTLAANGRALALDAAGKYVYVLEAPPDIDLPATIRTFSIDSSSGQIRASSAAPALELDTADQLYRGANGDFLYAIALGADAVAPGSIRTFGIGSHADANTGAPTQVAAADVPTGAGPVAMAFTSDGKFAYVLNAYDNTISRYTIGADGVPVAPAVVPPFAAAFVPALYTAHAGPNELSSIVIDPSNHYLYVGANHTDAIFRYAINPSTGALSVPPGGEYVVTGHITPKLAIVSSSKGAVLYGVNGSVISAFDIDEANGTLVSAQPAQYNLGGGPVISSMAFGQ